MFDDEMRANAIEHTGTTKIAPTDRLIFSLFEFHNQSNCIIDESFNSRGALVCMRSACRMPRMQNFMSI
jgi:hypothetical protein